MLYTIWHCTTEQRFTEVEEQPRRRIASVNADSLQEAFDNSQNNNDAWFVGANTRSTSVGDVIECDEGFYMVCALGFKLLDVMSKNESELNAAEASLYTYE
jgi:hypothetical protein